MSFANPQAIAVLLLQLETDVAAAALAGCASEGELAVVAGGGTRNLTGSFAGVLPAP